MFNFINSIIKGAIAIVASGVIAMSGFFSHKQVQIIDVVKPAIENQNQSSPIQGIVAENATKTVQENKPTTTIKTIVAPKSKLASPKLVERVSPFVATTTPPITVAVQQPVQEVNPLPPQIQIDPETFVGILCYFNASATNPLIGASVIEGKFLVRGSGVMINSKGYILTNRHIVVQQESTASIGNITNGIIKYQLDHCDVGQLPQGTHLPTESEIRTINPLVRITVLGYSAQLVFDSSSLPLSDIESEYADFAILRITGVSKDGPSFGFNSVPSSFPYAKLISINKYNIEGEGAVTYGFPGDVTAGQNDAFQTLTMTGSVGTISKVEVGDKYYANVPLVISTNMEISHGRSGSPLFWRGYVIGLTTFYISGNRTDSGSVASDAIIKGLQSTGYLEN